MKTPEEIVEEITQCFTGNGDYYFEYVKPEDCLKAIKLALTIPIVIVPKGTFCECEAPLIRTGNNTNGYCGSCGKDLN